MNKIVIIIIAVVAVAALIFGVFGFIRAGRVADFDPRGAMFQQGDGYGPGMMDRRGNNSGPGNNRMDSGFSRGMMGGSKDNVGNRGFNGMHEYMDEALAEELGYTVDELNTQMQDGKTILDIAADKGLTVAEFQTIQKDAMTTAIDNALKAGDISQNQADLMKENLANGRIGGFGPARR